MIGPLALEFASEVGEGRQIPEDPPQTPPRVRREAVGGDQPVQVVDGTSQEFDARHGDNSSRGMVSSACACRQPSCASSHAPVIPSRRATMLAGSGSASSMAALGRGAGQGSLVDVHPLGHRGQLLRGRLIEGDVQPCRRHTCSMHVVADVVHPAVRGRHLRRVAPSCMARSAGSRSMSGCCGQRWWRAAGAPHPTLGHLPLGHVVDRTDAEHHPHRRRGTTTDSCLALFSATDDSSGVVGGLPDLDPGTGERASSSARRRCPVERFEGRVAPDRRCRGRASRCSRSAASRAHGHRSATGVLSR